MAGSKHSGLTQVGHLDLAGNRLETDALGQTAALTPVILGGTAHPEGTVSAGQSSLYFQQGATGVIGVFVKEKGNGSVGWVTLEGILGMESAFGESLVANLHPVVQAQFQYNVNPDIVQTVLSGSGAVTQAQSMLVANTTAATNSTSCAYTTRTAHYNPGQGLLARYTAKFTAGVSGSTQHAGMINAEDGFAFGYNGAAFGILHRSGGQRKIVSFQITSGSSGAGNVTVTLNGVAKTVALTGALSVENVAKEVAAADWTVTGGGWETFHQHDTCYFVSVPADVLGGTYSWGGELTTAATVTQETTGVAKTDTWIPQASWNGADILDGAGASGATLDPTLGNVFMVQMQWLGFGGIRFFVEENDSSKLIEVHRIKYANLNATPSIANPTLPIQIAAQNTSNNTAIAVSAASVAIFVEGKTNGVSPNRSIVEIILASGTTETVIWTLKNPIHYQNVTNRIAMVLKKLSVSMAPLNNRSGKIKLYRNLQVVGTSFAAIGADITPVDLDTTGSAFDTALERQLISVGLAEGTSVTLDVSDDDIEIQPGESISATVELDSAGAPAITVACNWEDLI